MQKGGGTGYKGPPCRRGVGGEGVQGCCRFVEFEEKGEMWGVGDREDVEGVDELC